MDRLMPPAAPSVWRSEFVGIDLTKIVVVTICEGGFVELYLEDGETITVELADKDAEDLMKNWCEYHHQNGLPK